ncbi:cytochrome c oxidase assembly protein [Mycolicibacterium fortuitum]|nr:cytochrome c oxidase assembly protein [Mycolicibacterium fortuitum]
MFVPRFGVENVGGVTSTAQLVGHWAATVTGAFCLGALVWIVVTARTSDGGRIDAAAFGVHKWIERTAAFWAVCSLAMILLSAANEAGIPIENLVRRVDFGNAILASEVALGWCVTAGCAALLAVWARFTLRWIGHCVALLPASVGVVAVPVTGNAGQGPDHDIATSAVIVFALALAILTGITMLAAVHRHVEHRIRVVQVVCGSVAVGYGFLLAALGLGGVPIWDSVYGRAVLGAGLLLVLVLVLDGALLASRRMPAMPADIAAAVVMVIVMAAVGVASTSIPPRFIVQEFSTWEIFLGYQLNAAPNALRLLTVWRFDPLLGTAAIVLALGYLVAVVVLRRRGDHWPVGRTLAWFLGCVALLIATSSGIRAYGSAMFSVHMGEHMALNMFVPVLLVLGAPVTLALRVLPTTPKGGAPGPREWLVWLVHAPVTRFLSHPVTAFLLFVGSLYLVYFTPLFDTLIRYHWGHELMSVHFLLTGYLYYWGIIGIDPGPRRLPFLGRLGLLFAVMPFHAFFGIATMTMTSSLGESFYRSVNLPWLQSISDDQHLGGAIAWGSSELPVIIVVIALVAQWARQDRRAGAREDRHSDRGYDDELDAYNAMLQELARTRR